jgi:hypothetical protein
MIKTIKVTTTATIIDVGSLPVEEASDLLG